MRRRGPPMSPLLDGMHPMGALTTKEPFVQQDCGEDHNHICSQ